MTDDSKSEIEFMLRTAFHHVPAGSRTSGAFAGEAYDEFWWRGCVLTEDMRQGEQGYLMVWFDGENFVTNHTYRHPTEIF